MKMWYNLIKNCIYYTPKKEVRCMHRKDGEKMNAIVFKTDKKFKPLDKKKKELLKKFIGSASSKLDLNKVRDEWKYGKN